jgi:hypothetical protein
MENCGQYTIICLLTDTKCIVREEIKSDVDVEGALPTRTQEIKEEGSIQVN